MEINKVQWRIIAKGEKLPCDSFLMKKDGTMTSMVTGAGVTVGQDAYYLPVEELRSFPKEESEDERIRKGLIDTFSIYYKDEPDAEWDGKPVKDILAWLEKQQKPADNVESKFKVGDWVVYDHIPYQVVELPKEGYINLGLKGNGKVVYAPSTYCRLWTIQDAKDGDVLADGNLPFIFKKIDSMMHSYAYCGISVDDGFKIESEGESGEWTWIQDIKPATKEQRDTLIKAMTDAGYTFNFEKKELKKVEQKPTEEYNITGIGSKHAQGKLGEMIKRKLEMEKQGEQKPVEWHREDEQNLNACLGFIPDEFLRRWLTDVIHEKYDNHTWSEEDETGLTNTIIMLKEGASLHFNKKDITKAVDFLRTLKERYTWRPSDEQMEALKYSTYCPNEQMSKVLFELYQDLDKLRG